MGAAIPPLTVLAVRTSMLIFAGTIWIMRWHHRRALLPTTMNRSNRLSSATASTKSIIRLTAHRRATHYGPSLTVKRWKHLCSSESGRLWTISVCCVTQGIPHRCRIRLVQHSSHVLCFSLSLSCLLSAIYVSFPSIHVFCRRLRHPL